MSKQAVEDLAVHPARKFKQELTTQQAADYLGVSVETLRHWVYYNIAPTHAKRFGRLHFRVDDLDAFIKANTVVRKAYSS